jgi:hypothetical protein
MEPAIIIVLAIAFAIVFRLMAGSFDGERVERYLKDQGYELIDRSWDPFGPGWFGEKDSRIYQVVYRDRQGCVHRAHVKTSMMSGVYLTNDRVVAEPGAESPGPAESLESEKERLQRRLAEIEAEQRRH